MSATPALSPMLEQYWRIKKEQKGNVLFFRLGDFYEMFADDAIEVSGLLNLTLTTRNGLPMCGIPYHAVRSYISRLLRLGKKVAICEQIATAGKGLFERQVIEVVTPGTTVDEDYLDNASGNYLAALFSEKGIVSFAYIDLSTGEFRATAFPLEKAEVKLLTELERLQLREIIVQESLLEENEKLKEAVLSRPNLVVNRWTDWLFDAAHSRKRLLRQFGLESLKGFGLEDGAPEIVSSGALLEYLEQTAKGFLSHIRTITVYGENEYVGIDESTIRNLELVRNIHDGDVKYSLLEVMDETKTAMGKRVLKRRILHPLRDIAAINKRLGIVEAFYNDQTRLKAMRETLGRATDLERLCSRLAMNKAHGKDLVSGKNALVCFRRLEELSADLNIAFESKEAAALSCEDIEKLDALHDLLERGIRDEPSTLLSEGNLIREGYSIELDKLHGLRDNSRSMIEKYLEEEKTTTGISSLKIKYNRLLGFYFEVTKLNLDKVPPYFIKRQGIVAGMRFTTDRLANLESDINGARDKIVELERSLFSEIREEARALIPLLSASAQRIAELDFAQSLARAASVHRWVRPVVDDKNRLTIIEGRHPIVETHIPRGEFIPNDACLDCEETPFALITGPNMAGKSTYLRQAALVTLMAQMGSFVPASRAEIGVVDRVYCRVGASDNISRGESTFLVEMNETAYILNTATERSFVIMDEVGRGTGTKDGLSIAWAVCEELLDRIKCRTLFATHYHELSAIDHARLINRSMRVDEEAGVIIFRRKIQDGPAAESYGIHAARLAGLSEKVLERAAQIMERFATAGAPLIVAPPSDTPSIGAPSVDAPVAPPEPVVEKPAKKPPPAKAPAPPPPPHPRGWVG
jgi:DNA mismatch repair protein MutS